MNQEASESFRIAALLAVTGGFLESYSFLLHGHVFANAQTGNIALCGMALAMGNMVGAVKYALPVMAFGLGVIAVDWIRGKWSLTSYLIRFWYSIPRSCSMGVGIAEP